VGAALELPDILNRPFPGPTSIRILGDILPRKCRPRCSAPMPFISLLKEHGLYSKVWQAGAMFVQSVGVMGDERTTMGSGPARRDQRRWHDRRPGPPALMILAEVSNKIINQCAVSTA
jgi:GMP synthase (glutamine-hydrolysing)